jgi:hypothetical protein
VPVDEGTEDQEVFVFLLEFDQVPCVVPLLKPWPLPYSLPSRPVTCMPAVPGSFLCRAADAGIHEICCGLPRASECPNGQRSGLNVKDFEDFAAHDGLQLITPSQ